MIETAYFNTRYWDGNGGRSDRRPVTWTETDPRGYRTQRIFISAAWYRDWPTWKEAADRALLAAQMQYDAFSGAFEKRGSGDPISGSPQYLLEKSAAWGGELTVWINALCPSEAEFERVKAEAQEKTENQGKPLAGMRICDLTAPLPMLPVNSAEFQDKPGTVGELLSTL